jgi:hypothetical protein
MPVLVAGRVSGKQVLAEDGVIPAAAAEGIAAKASP